MTVRPLVAAAALLSMLASSAWARPAAAAEDRDAGWLDWASADGAEACPDASELAHKVEKLLGHSPAQAATEMERRLVLRVRRDPGNPPLWLGEVTILDAQGEMVGSRRITRAADSCLPIADTLALMAALSLSTSALAPPEEAPTAPIAPAKQQPAPAAPDSSTAPPVASARSGFMLACDAGLAFSAGMLPHPSPGAEARLRLSPPAGPVLYAAFTWWRQQEVARGGGPGATIDLWTVGLGGCWTAHSAGRLALGLCGGADAGRLHASGIGFGQAGTAATTAFVDLALGGDVEARITPSVLVGLTLQLAIPITRGRVAFAQTSNQETIELWQGWSAFPLAFLHVGYIFR
jgi:hypothetical protein